MPVAHFLRGTAALIAFAAAPPLPALADEDKDQDARASEIVVTGKVQPATPATRSTVTARQIETKINAVNVEDTVKYLPSLVVRKRNIGDTQAPLATRTSGLGASARNLIYADGALLSALIGNNNTSASPRWSLVSPQEIERIDVLYGPFSAAYPGSSIGAVVNITTRLPDKLEATAQALANLQDFELYGTDRYLRSYQYSGSVGDRFGPFAFFASATHTDSKTQPISFVTAIRPAAPGAAGTPTVGGYDDFNRTGSPIRVFGAGGLEHHRQDMLKLKTAFDISPAVRIAYTGGLFLDETSGRVESYVRNAATGAPIYSGAINSGGYGYSLATSAFASGIYLRDARHWSHTLSIGGAGGAFDWKLIGTLYDFGREIQRTPTAVTGAAGNVTRLDGTGWRTLDGSLGWNSGGNTLRIGAHLDQYEINSNRYSTADWQARAQGALNQASRGKTRTAAIWAENTFAFAPALKLTLGGRYEWWRAFDGFNFSTSPALSVDQPERRAEGFSPKATLAWSLAPALTARASIGRAYRFPTVGELYQAITTGAVLTVPDPSLRPERAWSEELALEYADGHGTARLALFNESIADALISQSAPLLPGSTQLFTYFQNVDRTRARGIELAFDRRDVMPRFDVAGSVTYTDAETVKDAAFPVAVGKTLPSVPRWKATAVVTWRADDAVSLTAAARYASRNWGSLDNSDIVGNTYQGFYEYLVVDARAHFKAGEHLGFSLGVDNLFNDKYFLFHPFTQRSVTVEAKLRL